MIPKIIHYCWFGGTPLPKSAKKCIASWKKFLPDYEIKEWNESNFNVNIIPYTAEAYQAKKYAFVSDYARFWILNQFGGLYFDTDVEVISSFDDIIEKGSFMGFEDNDDGCYSVNPGLGMGSECNMDFLNHILSIYEHKSFSFDRNMDNVVILTTNELVNEGLNRNNKFQHVIGFNIYSTNFFCPLSMLNGNFTKDQFTHSIHRYDGSWLSKKQKRAMYIKMHYGEKIFKILCKIQKLIRFHSL
jgi:mannosyltransferase OCH1-like enzyme